MSDATENKKGSKGEKGKKGKKGKKSKKKLSIKKTKEGKPKKRSLPNKKNPACTPESELIDRQDRAEVFARITSKIFPSLLKFFANIRDPRKGRQGKARVKYSMQLLMLYGVIVYLLMEGSGREANRDIPSGIVFANLSALFPELEAVPHFDTLKGLLGEMDVEEIQAAYMRMLRMMVLCKRFDKQLRNGKFLVAVDGTQKCISYWECDEGMLHRSRSDGTTDYYVYVLEAVIVLANGAVLPLCSEFNEPSESAKKQDCEHEMCKRIVDKIHQVLGGRAAIMADGLYCDSVIKACFDKRGWDYMITFKEGCMPAVWAEVMDMIGAGLAEVEVREYGDRRQVFHFVNDVGFDPLKPHSAKNIGWNVVICDESWEEAHPITESPQVERKESRWAWISQRRLTRLNVMGRCQEIGRWRWRIENNILVEKAQGYHYEHMYARSVEKMKGFHYLMKIAHFCMEMVFCSQIAAPRMKAEGKGGYHKRLVKALAGAVLDAAGLRGAKEGKFYWKLNDRNVFLIYGDEAEAS